MPQIINGGRFFDKEGNRVHTAAILSSGSSSSRSSSSATVGAAAAAGQLWNGSTSGEEGGWRYNKAGVRVLTDIAADKY